MARKSWIDSDDLPALDEHVSQLAHFADSLKDGVVDREELETQERNLIAAMKAVESELSDEQHVKVTRLLAELTAYSVMQVMHGLATERVRKAIG
jgi:hypothetical protein